MFNATFDINILFFAEIAGYIGLVLGITALQLKNGKNILGMLALMNIFWCAHYGLSGAYLGALMVSVGFFRNASGYFLPSIYMKKVALISSAISVTLGLGTAESLIYLTATCGNLTNNITVILRDRPVHLRSAQITAELFWLTYAITMFSVPAIIFGLFMISSNIVGFIRHEKDFINGLSLRFIQKDRTLLPPQTA